MVATCHLQSRICVDADCLQSCSRIFCNSEDCVALLRLHVTAQCCSACQIPSEIIKSGEHCNACVSLTPAGPGEVDLRRILRVHVAKLKGLPLQPDAEAERFGEKRAGCKSLGRNISIVKNVVHGSGPLATVKSDPLKGWDDFLGTVGHAMPVALCCTKG